jgi:hypothetical protein
MRRVEFERRINELQPRLTVSQNAQQNHLGLFAPFCQSHPHLPIISLHIFNWLDLNKPW